MSSGISLSEPGHQGGAHAAHHGHPTATAGPYGRVLALSPNLPSAMDRHRWCLGDYTLKSTLHTGYASAVHLATCKHSGTDVVLKVYARCTQAPDVAQHEMYREVSIQSSLQHTHVVHLFAAFQDGVSLVLVQEYAPQGDLLALMQEQGGRLPEATAVQLVLQPLLQALHYLHRWGVIHRDIKPENVLFGTDGKGRSHMLKLGDFGLAINLLEERPISRVGTLDYMAPEVLRCPVKQNMAAPCHVARYSAHVDVWACGVMAYELLVGVPPFAADSRSDAESRIHATSFTFPTCTSPAARDFISRALSPHPGDRPTVRELMQHPWITGSKMPYQPAPPAVPGQQQHHHHPLHAASWPNAAGARSFHPHALHAAQPALTRCPSATTTPLLPSHPPQQMLSRPAPVEQAQAASGHSPHHATQHSLLQQQQQQDEQVQAPPLSPMHLSHPLLQQLVAHDLSKLSMAQIQEMINVLHQALRVVTAPPPAAAAAEPSAGPQQQQQQPGCVAAGAVTELDALPESLADVMDVDGSVSTQPAAAGAAPEAPAPARMYGHSFGHAAAAAPRTTADTCGTTASRLSMASASATATSCASSSAANACMSLHGDSRRSTADVTAYVHAYGRHALDTVCGAAYGSPMTLVAHAAHSPGAAAPLSAAALARHVQASHNSTLAAQQQQQQQHQGGDGVVYVSVGYGKSAGSPPPPCVSYKEEAGGLDAALHVAAWLRQLAAM